MKKITKKEIKKKIKELRFSSFKKRITICILVSFISLVCINFLFNDLENKVGNYDYSSIEEKQAIIIKSYKDIECLSQSTHCKTFSYINLRLTTGELVTISVQSHSQYTEGEEIIVYTNGDDYSLTKQGVALEANNGVFYVILICFTSIFVMYIWSYLFRVKGFIISLFMVAIACIIFVS